MLIKINCNICNKEFYRKDSEIKRRKKNYCSYACSYIGKRKDKSKACLNCSKTFWARYKTQKFCSHACAVSFNNLGRKIYKEIYKECICLYCKNKFIQKKHKKQFCSNECSIRFKKDSKIKRFLNGELTDRQVRSKPIREYLIEKQEGICVVCKNPPFHNGKPLIFIVDHIDGIFTNNNPENIRAICPNCNSQTDTFSGKNTKKNKEKRHKENGRI